MTSPDKARPADDSGASYSSAEMTAAWRCREPAISLDSASLALARPAGLELAEQFDREVYAGAARHVGLRARYFREQILAAATHCDGHISFGSGFSLQSYYLSAALGPKWTIIDADLEDMAAERGRRLDGLAGSLPKDLASAHPPQRRAIDLEEAAREGRSLRAIFPEMQAPCIAIEGVVFYLTRTCLRWLFTEIAGFDAAVLVFDYWPAHAIDTSRSYRRLLDFFAMGMAESVQKLIDPADLPALIAPLRIRSERDLAAVERHYQEAGLLESLVLQDPSELLPCHFVVAEKAKL